MKKNPCGERLVCTNPFEWFEIHPDGRVFLCCPAWLKLPVGNLLESPVADIWNGEKAVMIRKAVLNGSFHHCNKKRCPKLHTGCAPVVPLSSLAGEVGEAMRAGKALLPYGPKKLNLCYDRSCNLACASCRTDFHCAGGDEKEKVSRIAGRLLNEASRSAETILISGTGDPFGSRSFRELLQGFRPEGWPMLEKIHLHSNGQLWDEAMWSKMAGIHPYVSSAEISVDAACPETYAENRRGGDFARLMRNLDFIADLPIRTKISFVVQKNNYGEMPAFVELGRRRRFEIYFSQLVNWGTFGRKDFLERAVHLPGHPEHGELLTVLTEVAQEEGVDLGNLAPLAAGSQA